MPYNGLKNQMPPLIMEENKALIPFEGKPIRKVWHNEEWFFSIIDVISILTDSKDPNQYWKKLKSRDPQMATGVQIVPLSIGKRKVLLQLETS